MAKQMDGEMNLVHYHTKCKEFAGTTKLKNAAVEHIILKVGQDLINYEMNIRDIFRHHRLPSRWTWSRSCSGTWTIFALSPPTPKGSRRM